jgi:erythromycin esterase-like protein
MDTSILLDRRQRIVSPELIGVVRQSAESLPAPEDADAFGRVFDRFGDAVVVLLGEATHGSSEFYRARAAITRHLIQRHGFTIVALEADWPDARSLDRQVRQLGLIDERPVFQRFPTWMWRNAEFRDFVDWLGMHNRTLPPERRVELRGLDIYSLGESIGAVLAYLDQVDPPAAKLARRRYGCLTPWQDDPARYGYEASLGGENCEKEAVEQLSALLDRRLEYMRRDGEDFLDAEQNARIVRSAEHYYRIMYRGSRESWNIRDRHMFETLRALLHRRGPSAKAVVWAHNSHIGNAAATAMGWAGEFNIGELCRTAFGEEAVSIGFGTDRGTVAAASDWGEPVAFKTVLPARDDSYEHVFRKSGMARSLTDWRRRDNSELVDALTGPLLERAIGVVYRPDTEFLSHYFEAVLAEQFDAYVWFEETSAVRPLSGPVEAGAPDVYPTGV